MTSTTGLSVSLRHSVHFLLSPLSVMPPSPSEMNGSHRELSAGSRACHTPTYVPFCLQCPALYPTLDSHVTSPLPVLSLPWRSDASS